ncbi:MAG: hypothetical protein A2Z72_02020 [Omnitrophica bacterium RBG_13_46_9]|nr:MAG: hypothetical protein A2Z72_02020 [Omnitrophica bacterium RBG_13_46_9]
MMPNFIWKSLKGLMNSANLAMNRAMILIVAVLGIRLIRARRGWWEGFRRFENLGFHIYPTGCLSAMPDTKENFRATKTGGSGKATLAILILIKRKRHIYEV